MRYSLLGPPQLPVFHLVITKLQLQSTTENFFPLPSIMEGRGLTLRSKSRRQRPQISAPKPISGPLPANTRSPDPGQASIPAGRDRAPQSAATSDLVKRRYSTRFNGAPDLDANAPPVPALPSSPPGGYGGLGPPATIPRQPSPADGTAPAPKVDLDALRDPGLGVERCRLKLSL